MAQKIADSRGLAYDHRVIGRALFDAAERGEVGQTVRELAFHAYGQQAFATADDCQKVMRSVRELVSRGLIVQIGNGPFCLTQDGHEVFC